MIKNNKRFVCFLLCSLSIVYILSCKKESPTTEYFPHKEGEQWKYRTSEKSDYFTREFSGKTRINGTTYLNWIRTDFDTTITQPLSETSFVIVTDTTVEFFEDPESNPYILLKLPLEVDSTWSFVVDDDPISARVEGKENNFSVEAGSYDDVYVVRYDNPENDEIWRVYYAPNIGIIKKLVFDYEELDFEEELVEYPVK